jgi:hypothetical protein
VGEVAKARSKARMADYLKRLFHSLNRSVSLLDPLMPMRIEVPLHALACVWGVSKGRHYQFKFKPLIVSNETATLPLVWEGYHFVDRSTLAAVERLGEFVEAFRHPRISHRMKLTALAADPQEFIEVLIGLGGFNYETIVDRISQLSGGADTRSYLGELSELVVQTPLVLEIWG